jgi:hypothetical protein
LSEFSGKIACSQDKQKAFVIARSASDAAIQSEPSHSTSIARHAHAHRYIPCHCEERKPRGNPARTVAHKHRPPPCINTSDHPLVIASHKVARQSSGTECNSRLPALPLDCHVGPQRDPPRNDKVILYHREGITRNIPSGKDLFPLRDLHALHGQCFPFFGPLRQKPIHCFTFTMKTVKKRRNGH